jgi:hypothetical protein
MTVKEFLEDFIPQKETFITIKENLKGEVLSQKYHSKNKPNLCSDFAYSDMTILNMSFEEDCSIILFVENLEEKFIEDCKELEKYLLTYSVNLTNSNKLILEGVAKLMENAAEKIELMRNLLIEKNCENKKDVKFNCEWCGGKCDNQN